MRSAKAPMMSAGVMQAKVIWKMTKASSGMIGFLREGSDLRGGRDACQEELREAADEGVHRGRRVAGEGQRIAVDDPQDADDAEDDHHLHQDREDVLGADEAAVEQREARNGHQHDEAGGDEHPGGVSLVDGRRGFRRGRQQAGEGQSRRHRNGGPAHRSQRNSYVLPLEPMIRALQRRFRRCGCARPVRAAGRISCRRRSVRSGRPVEWLR